MVDIEEKSPSKIIAGGFSFKNELVRNEKNLQLNKAEWKSAKHLENDDTEDEGGSGGAGKRKGPTFKPDQLQTLANRGILNVKYIQRMKGLLTEKGYDYFRDFEKDPISGEQHEHDEKNPHADLKAEDRNEKNQEKQRLEKYLNYNYNLDANTSNPKSQDAMRKVDARVYNTPANSTGNSVFLSAVSREANMKKGVGLRGGLYGSAHANPHGFAKRDGEITVNPEFSIIETAAQKNSKSQNQEAQMETKTPSNFYSTRR